MWVEACRSVRPLRRFTAAPCVSIPPGRTGRTGITWSCPRGTLAHRIDGRDNCTFVIVGDGEFQEGQNWEAVMTAAQMNLDRLILFFDYNKVQMNGRVADINDQSNIVQRMRTFGWHTQFVNGHDVEQIGQGTYQELLALCGSLGLSEGFQACLM